MAEPNWYESWQAAGTGLAVGVLGWIARKSWRKARPPSEKQLRDEISLLREELSAMKRRETVRDQAISDNRADLATVEAQCDVLEDRMNRADVFDRQLRREIHADIRSVKELVARVEERLASAG